MAIIITETVTVEDGVAVTHKIGTDDETGAVLWEHIEEATEAANRDALADTLHRLLPQVARMKDNASLPDDVRALAEVVLLMHRFLHADYTAPAV